MYEDRTHAGRTLGALAAGFHAETPLVLAIPRGGVIVGRETALLLESPLDVVMAKKIGAPFNPEYAVAAVDPDGQVLTLDGDAWESLRSYIDRQAILRRRELQESLRRFRGGREEKPVSGRTVFLVDDGLATGLTAMAAIRYVRRKNPKELILAVPVAPEDSLAAIRPLVDAVICPLVPRIFHAVGEWYRAFDQVEDPDVIGALEELDSRRP